MAKTILFVDEENFARKALQRSFRDMRNQWEMRFAGTPEEGFAVLAAEPVDVLVTEVVFTQHSGIDFLYDVRRRSPQLVRIIMSGYADQNVILKGVDLAHQYLAKPCDHAQLKATITKAFFIRDLLAQEPLKKVVAGIDSLPSLPSLYLELVDELRSEEASIQRVGDIISRDISFTAKLLKTVNSSFFGLPQRVTSPAKAVGLLGLDLVQSIVLASGTFDKFKRLKFQGFSVGQLWEHAMETAMLARIIARQAGLDTRDVETAFLAGLLHDIGKLLVAAHLPEKFNAILQIMHTDNSSMALAELVTLGTTHAAIGAYLLGLWGLPDTIVEATAYHHSPGTSSKKGLSIPGLIHIANAFAHGGPVSPDRRQIIENLDYQYLEDNDLLGQIREWQAVCAGQLES